jgi:hypothetical protein
MSDFLIAFGNKYKGSDLLELLKQPYGKSCPKGQQFEFPWGSMAVLEDHLAGNNNILEKDSVVFAWVGDLITEMTGEFIDALINRAGQIRNRRPDETVSLESDEVFRELNGAYAIVIADEQGISIVGDLLNLVQIYVGYDTNKKVSAIGTHSDLVAALIGESFNIDHVSAAEVLNFGRIVFPNTMHQNVKQIRPACIHNIRLGKNNAVEMEDFSYWHPSKEQEQYNEDELASELRTIFVDAVRKRCKGKRIAISMSGGLDSRLIMATASELVDCIGLTFCDELNRETRIAKKATESYGLQWFPIFRDKEYVGNILEKTVNMIGCEGRFEHAHAVGLTDEIGKHNISSVLTGMNMDTFLKAYEAADIVRTSRMCGLLPPKYVRKNLDLAGEFKDFWHKKLTQSILDNLKERKTVFVSHFADMKRSSLVEWLFLYPTFTGFVTWPSERRLIPIIQVVLDKKLIEFSFKCPVSLKLGKRIFLKAVKELYGVGSQIPNVSDGVRPGSGHWSRLAQRMIRKFQDGTTAILEKLGKEPTVQHSWHDYQKYWRESTKFDELRKKYGHSLDRLDGVLFKESGRALLEDKDIDWRYGFRLIQLAVWLGINDGYRRA